MMRKTLDYDVPVITVSQDVLACAPQMEITDFEFIEEPNGLFAPFTPEVCTMAGVADKEGTETPTLDVFVTAQASDVDYRAACISVGKPNTLFNVSSDEVLVRVSPLDGTLQQAVSASLRPCFLHVFHYSILAANNGKSRVYDFMRKHMYWAHTADDVFATMRDCRSCIRNRTHGKHQWQLKLFFPKSSL